MKNVMLVILLVSVVFLSSETVAQNAMKQEIKGVVTNSLNRPVATVMVILNKDGKQLGKSITGDDGKFFIGNLVPGIYNLQVKKGDKVLFQKQVSLPKDKVSNIKLPQ